jgi:Asp-tRNA(Asn)/Glu-tRNA(Gln) amidotransferase A subunit family amidase
MKINLRNTLYGLVICVSCFLVGALMGTKADEQSITIGMIGQASKILGLSFSDAESDSMITELEDLRKSTIAIRKVALDNSVAPALNFNPIPVGYQFPDQTSGFKLGPLKKTSLPANREELAFYSVRELADLIKNRKITSVELTQFFIERLKKYNSKLLNVVSFTEERAMKQATLADAEIKAGKYRGVLHGIPFGVKDLLSTKDYKTTWGSVPYKDQLIATDATVVKRLEAAGAVLIAKLTLGELAMGDVWFGGKTRNPWDLNRGSSGSSAGSASAVSAGCLPFAIGSETLGSIVSPSTECGVSGLRPSFGRISKHGAMALSWSMDKLGPIARTVEDCALVFQAVYGSDGQDLSVINAPFNYDGSKKLKGLRVGYLEKDFQRKYANRVNDSLTLAKLKELGAELVPIQLPQMPYNDLVIILSAECGAAFQDLVISGKDDLLVMQNKNAWPNTFRGAQFISAATYINANRVRTLLIQQIHEQIKGLDLYISPSFGANLTASNLSGHPSVVLPNGFNSKGLPASITFMGQLFGEGKLLQAAQAYQQSTDFHKKHPQLNF